MSHYLDQNRLYVMNEEDQVVYVVNQYHTYYGANYLSFNLAPIAYRKNKSEDWKMITAEEYYDSRDIPEDQTVNLFFMSENLIECLESDNYTIMINGGKILMEIPDDMNDIINEINKHI